LRRAARTATQAPVAASRIQRRLLLSYLALLVGALLPAAFFLGSWVGDEARRGLERTLLSQARSLALEIGRATPGDWSDWTAAMGQALQARVTVIAPDGTVLGDSEVPRERLGTLENHGHRPEVVAALGGGEGLNVRRSATLERDMMYVAVPVGPLAGPVAGSSGRGRHEVLRLALPLDQVTRTVARGYGAVVLAGLLALVLAIGLGTLLALRWSRPVVAMTQAARAMTRGNFHAPLPAPGDDELGDLVHVLGTLRGQLATHLEELRNEGERLRTILHAMGEGVALISDGRVTVANPAFAELLGAQVVEGRSLLEAARLVPLHEAIDRAIGTGTPVSSELELGSRALCFRVVPIGPPAAREGVVVLLDVTEARRIERMRRDFVANASHELRTPVAAVLAAAETLATLSSGAGEEPVARATFLDILQRHALRLSRLTSDLLELSRLEAGHEPHIESVSVAAALETVLAELGPRAQAKSIAIESQLAPGLPEVAAETAALEQILNNLLDNAIKYTPAGGRVTVSARADEREVTLVVSDTGPGIPEPHLGRIFERFYRVDSARSRELGGTGLGLAIVKHLALSMGGSVGVESDVGRGSRFLVRLPRAR
jgi:two-component system phosphate regulon sensor histidine kinase PhoR